MFNQITIIDRTGLKEWAKNELQKYSKKEILAFQDNPGTDSETIDRIGDSDCVLVSWHTQLSHDVIMQCENLKYVGMCCSLYDEQSANVDITTARERGITVRGIRDYGDEGLVEFIISELIRVAKGLGKYQWKEEPVELTHKKLGIIGLGTTGQMLANRAAAFNMDLYYFNRSRKKELEIRDIKYLPLDELLKEVEIISFHLPRHTNLMGDKEFRLFGNGKILINTSLGLTFDKDSFVKWIRQEGNYALFDADGIGEYEDEFQKLERIMISKKVSGWTSEARERLSKKVIENISTYWKERSY